MLLLLAERSWQILLLWLLLLLLLLVVLLLFFFMFSLIWAIFTKILCLKENLSVFFSFPTGALIAPLMLFCFPAWNHGGKYMVVIDDSRELDWPTVFLCCYPKVTAQTNGTTRWTKKNVGAKRQEDKSRNQFGGELSGVTEVLSAVLLVKLELNQPLSQS